MEKNESPWRPGARYLCNPDGSMHLVHVTYILQRGIKRESHKQAVASGTLNTRAQQREVSVYINRNVRRRTASSLLTLRARQKLVQIPI